MGLGLSKSFTIFLFISIAIAYGTENWKNGVVFMTACCICIAIWKLMTE